MERKFWKGLLLTGITLHLLAALLMPLGLDAHVHASYVSDGMNDGEAHLEWGHLRANSEQGSVPSEVAADDKWFAWHLIIEMWFSVFSISRNNPTCVRPSGGIRLFGNHIFSNQGIIL